MKKVLILAFALTTVLISHGQQKSKPDTVRSVGIFIEPYQGYVKTDFIFKILRDTFAYKQINADTQKKVAVKDTQYFVPTYIPLFDSLRRPVLDSLKNPKGTYQFLPVGKQNIIWDFNKKL